jgi:hypothetical protein
MEEPITKPAALLRKSAELLAKILIIGTSGTMTYGGPESDCLLLCMDHE